MWSGFYLILLNSVPITVLLYRPNGVLLCGFNVTIKWIANLCAKLSNACRLAK